MQYQRRKVKDISSLQQIPPSYKFNQFKPFDKIMQALNGQQDKIQSLLKKYGEQQVQQTQPYLTSLNNKISRTIPVDQDYKNNRSIATTLEGLQKYQIKKDTDRILKLPNLNQNQLEMGNNRLPKIKSSMEGVEQKQKHKLKSKKKNSIIKVAYMQIDKLNVSKPKPKRKRFSQHKKSKTSRQNSIPTLKQTKLEIQNVDVQQQSRQIRSESSVGEQPVSLTEYYKQFKQLIQKQTDQQLNFLYFSKTESNTDWKQSILNIFEKHDRDLLILRKKSKYLEKFDQGFFTCNYIQ